MWYPPLRFASSLSCKNACGKQVSLLETLSVFIQAPHLRPLPSGSEVFGPCFCIWGQPTQAVDQQSQRTAIRPIWKQYNQTQNKPFTISWLMLLLWECIQIRKGCINPAHTQTKYKHSCLKNLYKCVIPKRRNWLRNQEASACRMSI